MNTRKPPFKDQGVRQATHIALDRQAALKVLAHGQEIIGKPFTIEPWGIPMNELLNMPGYRQPKDADIAGAKRLLAEASFPKGFKTRMLASRSADV